MDQYMEEMYQNLQNLVVRGELNCSLSSNFYWKFVY